MYQTQLKTQASFRLRVWVATRAHSGREWEEKRERDLDCSTLSYNVQLLLVSLKLSLKTSTEARHRRRRSSTRLPDPVHRVMAIAVNI